MRLFAARTHSRLNREELLHFRWLLGGGLALLSIWTLFYLEAAIWPVALLATAAILLVLLFPGIPGRVPEWLWRLGVPVISVFFAIDLALNEMIPAFVRLNVLLVLHRACSYRTRREDLQLVALCLFLVIITGVLTVSLVFAVQIILFTAWAMVFLFVVNIAHSAIGNETVPPETWAMISRKRLCRRLWQVLDLRLTALGGGLLLAVLGISVVIFLSIPRFQMDSALNFLNLTRTRVLTGFSERIALGEVTELAQDHRIAMRVDVSKTDSALPLTYWRMVVLDAYENGVFSVSPAITAHVGVRSIPTVEYNPEWLPFEHNTATKPRGPRPQYTVFLEAGISRFLPLPSHFTGVTFTELQDIIPNKYFRTLETQNASASLLSLKIDGADFSGTIPDPLFATTQLETAASHARLRTVQAATGLSMRYMSYPGTTLAVPVSATEHEYLREVVAEITGGLSLESAEFARRACAYLAEHHRYSLGAALPPATDEITDPVVRWLQAGSSGHCEFFTGAFTLLSRTAGFPTRAITGFKGGTWNAYENYFMVRNSDAHSWCEVYDGVGAWLRVDPTPGAGSSAIATAAAAPAISYVATDHSFRAYLDSLRMIWYRRIVSFDRGSQRQVAGQLRRTRDVALRWSRAFLVTARQDFNDWTRRPWDFGARSDLVYTSIALFLATIVMRRLGIGTSDLLAWLRTGEQPTRRRAGELLRRLRLKLAEPPRRQFDVETARRLEEQLCMIRFGRVEQWPAPPTVFRAARRML